MASDPQKLGNETRSNILPVSSTSDFLGPDYSYADELPMPDEVGVRKGSSLGSVIDAAKGIAYYTDMIGYGGSSSSMSRGLGKPVFPMGVNYFMPTKTQCSNGANMSYYMEGVTQGTAFGKRIQTALQRMGAPGLRGLAPGILEDAKEGLDPSPVLNAVFGSGYAKCKLVTKPVGDYLGKMKSVDGKEWIRPMSPNDIKYPGGKPSQTRWVFDRWMTQEEYQDEFSKREFCPDGTKIVDHLEGDCDKALIANVTLRNVKESFLNKEDSTIAIGPLSVAALLTLLAVVYLRRND